MPMLASPAFIDSWLGPRKQARKERYHEKLAFHVKDIIMGDPVTKDSRKKRAVKALQKRDTAVNIVNILKAMPDPTAPEEERAEEVVEEKRSNNDVNGDTGNAVNKKTNHFWSLFTKFHNHEMKTMASSKTPNPSEPNSNPSSDSRVVNASADISVTKSSNLKPILHLRPPTNEISAHVYWWGYEIYVPEPCMGRLDQAQNVSQAFIGFVRSVASGVAALAPYWGFISAWVGLQFTIIKAQDTGRGVVLAATWVLPVALIPRPWDIED